MNVETRYNLRMMLLPMSIYFVNRFTNIFSAIPHLESVFQYHFNDYLGAIVIMAFTNFMIIYSGRSAITSFQGVLAAGALCSIAWEVIAPWFLPYSTPDWRDCIAYLVGMVTYYLITKIHHERIRVHEKDN